MVCCVVLHCFSVLCWSVVLHCVVLNCVEFLMAGCAVLFQSVPWFMMLFMGCRRACCSPALPSAVLWSRQFVCVCSLESVCVRTGQSKCVCVCAHG